MLFHTHDFFALLLVTLITFRIARSGRQWILLISSLMFYTYAGVATALLFFAIILFNYFCYLSISQGQGLRWLSLAITVDLANLFMFKYFGFLLSIFAGAGLDYPTAQGWVSDNVILPVGISFYTFQLIALLVDTYRGKSPRVKDLKEFFVFITFFGQLIAGPIMHGREFLPQLRHLNGARAEQIAGGVVVFLIGLVKKVLIADWLLAPIVETLFARSLEWDTPTSWFLGILFGFQIYFDFSGYCDMAIGLGRFFGLELRVNFSTPYISRTPSEFWNRWNITLSQWFGAYVYIPLGGSRISLPKTAVNIFATMLVSGLWHGAGYTFVVWGVIHGVYLSAFHVLRWISPGIARSLSASRISFASIIGWAFTTVVCTIGWVYFRADSTHQANAIVLQMLGGGGGSVSGPIGRYALVSGLLISAHFIEYQFWRNFPPMLEHAMRCWSRFPGPCQALIAFLVLFGVIAMTKKTQGAFIYFQF